MLVVFLRKISTPKVKKVVFLAMKAQTELLRQENDHLKACQKPRRKTTKCPKTMGWSF